VSDTKPITPPAESWKEWIQNLASQIDIVSLLFFVLVVFLISVLARWQRDKVGDYANFDLSDVIMKNGRVSREALFEWIGVIGLTFVLIHQEFKDVVTDWFVLVYVGAVLAKGITNLVKGNVSLPRDLEPPSASPPEDK
jgi:hypothetical protein